MSRRANPAKKARKAAQRAMAALAPGVGIEAQVFAILSQHFDLVPKVKPPPAPPPVAPSVPSQRLSARQQKAIDKDRCAACPGKGAHILITHGADAEGNLQTFAFCSKACAAKGGFPWAR